MLRKLDKYINKKFYVSRIIMNLYNKLMQYEAVSFSNTCLLVQLNFC